ncbi:transposase [Reticulibacter mediterranei]|nr:transposase [Reticulibacter mediterranei]
MRSPYDLPSSGLSVHLQLSVRRFRCQNEDCPRQTFVERLPELVAVSAQRTVRLTRLLYAFSLALSGEAGARLLLDAGILTSPDTLLRLVKGGQLPITKTPKAIGVDDFALRRGQTYGTIIVDLSTHRPIDLLPERTAETLSQWLVEHPGIEFISRDRSSEYMRGATEGAPQAQQVLDRWHVLKNVREVVQRIVNRNHASLKQRQKDAGVIVRARYKKKRSSSEIAASQVARLRRQAWYEEVVELYRQGNSIAAIAQQLQMSPTTVRKFVYAGAFPERSAHRSRRIVRLEPYLPYLEQRVQEGCENASLLWQEICQQGFTHGYKVVNTWLREYLEKPGRNSSQQEIAKRQAFFDVVQAEQGVVFSTEEMMETAQGESLSLVVEPLESPRHLTWLLLRDPGSLNVQEQQKLAFLREVEALNTTYELVQRFFEMVREQQADLLDNWLQACEKSKVPDLQTFAEGLKREYSAMKGALQFSYSNGPVEGQVNKLKYVKRSMYGREKFALLHQRFLQAA